MRRRRNKDSGYEPAVMRQMQPNQQIYWPYPTPQKPNVTVAMPNTGNYQSYGVGTIIGLPQYQSIDEYGRVFHPPLLYGAQPCSAPVPVAIPSSIVQTTPITLPLQMSYGDNK
ncbi:MAG: hypothetical protein QM214_03620 [Bacillota bacterium]|jgi:hypothetical protein|nr:hypothetical protein [Bacillota bacterium]